MTEESLSVLLSQAAQSRKRRCCGVLIERKKELCSSKTDGTRVRVETVVSEEFDSCWRGPAMIYEATAPSRQEGTINRHGCIVVPLPTSSCVFEHPNFVAADLSTTVYGGTVVVNDFLAINHAGFIINYYYILPLFTISICRGRAGMV